ncbi:MAG: cation-translocating P-type ATPase [Candidatus Binataceae bacterium]
MVELNENADRSVDERTEGQALKGLTAAEAKRRLVTFGPNRLAAQATLGTRIKRVLGTVADPMALMLLAAAGLYLALGDRHDALVLIVAAVPVLAVDLLFEARASNALKRLASSVAPRARVVRDGKELEIATAALVPGDLLILREGDILHADGIVRWAANLTLDESQLTGESEPREKRPSAIGAQVTLEDVSAFHAGSLVLSGHGYGEITTTGAATRFGNIARLVGQASERTPLERKTARMAAHLLIVGIVVSAGIFILMMLRGHKLTQAFLYAITVAVSAVPEEYPLVLTLFLSLGAWRLGRQGVLVRRLASVETLGSTTVICLDKTGTLTKGSYALETVLSVRPDVARHDLLEAAALACEINAADPIDRAILNRCHDDGLDVVDLHSRWKLLYDYPFEMRGKHMSHVWVSTVSAEEHGKSRARIVAKGSLEGILEHCVLTPEELKAVGIANVRLAGNGMRVLAVAGREGYVRAPDTESSTDSPLRGREFTGARSNDEQELTLYGLLGFHDPLRPEVSAAVAQCQAGGIRLKLITGDHVLTAHAIAEAAGILHEDSAILTGTDIDAMSPDGLMKAAKTSDIFARVRPEQKYAIVDALVRAGEIVAMTGDGINDAPALRRANIGVSMGQRGTEAARAAAGLVLLEDNFGALVKTIREGRQIFANIQRAFLFLVGFKVMVVSLALFAPMLGLPVLLLLVQIVWLELVVHPVAALVFEGERAPYDLMRLPPRPPTAPLMPLGPALRAAVSGGLLAAGALALYAFRLDAGIDYARSVAMVVVIGGAILLAWSELAAGRPWWRTPVTRISLIVLVGVAATAPLCMTLPPLAALLHMRLIAAADWALAAGVILVALGWRVFGWRGRTVRVEA